MYHPILVIRHLTWEKTCVTHCVPFASVSTGLINALNAVQTYMDEFVKRPINNPDYIHLPMNFVTYCFDEIPSGTGWMDVTEVPAKPIDQKSDEDLWNRVRNEPEPTREMFYQRLLYNRWFSRIPSVKITLSPNQKSDMDTPFTLADRLMPSNVPMWMNDQFFWDILAAEDRKDGHHLNRMEIMI